MTTHKEHREGDRKSKSQDGVMDWDIFHAELKTMIEHAQNEEKLREAMRVTVEKLLKRPGEKEEENKEKLHAIFEKIFKSGKELALKKDDICEVVKRIIENRKRIHAILEEAGKLEDGKTPRDSTHNDIDDQLAPLPPVPQEGGRTFDVGRVIAASHNHNEENGAGKAEENAEQEEEKKSEMQKLFEREIIRIWENQFKKMRKGAGSDTPFFMSEEFQKRFFDTIKDELLTQLYKRCSTMLIGWSDKQNGDEISPAALRSFIEDRTNRETILNAWNEIWKGFTKKKDLPEKPEKKEVNKGMLKGMARLISKDDKKAEEEREKWQEKCKIIKGGNAKRNEFIAHICEGHAAYQPPREQDMQLLGEIFSMDMDGMRKGVTAIQQIIKQTRESDESRLGEALANFLPGKGYDLEVVIVYFQAYKYDDETKKMVEDTKLSEALQHIYRAGMRKNPKKLCEQKPLLSHFVLGIKSSDA